MTHVVFQPLELVEARATVWMFAARRLPAHRYHGVLAPRAERCREIIAARSSNQIDGKEPDDDASGCAHTPRRWAPWAKLMQRVFAIDVLECPRCGGKMKILATIHLPKRQPRFSSRSDCLRERRPSHHRSTPSARRGSDPSGAAASPVQRRFAPPERASDPCSQPGVRAHSAHARSTWCRRLPNPAFRARDLPKKAPPSGVRPGSAT